MFVTCRVPTLVVFVAFLIRDLRLRDLFGVEVEPLYPTASDVQHLDSSAFHRALVGHGL